MRIANKLTQQIKALKLMRWSLVDKQLSPKNGGGFNENKGQHGN